MSKREIQEKKLDTRVVWGVVFSGIAVLGTASWLLVRHKNKKVHERAEELEVRTSLRLTYLERRHYELTERHNSSTDEAEKSALQELLSQNSELRQRISSERSLPIDARLALEQANEALAELEHSIHPDD